jgi:hypothetical protein
MVFSIIIPSNSVDIHKNNILWSDQVYQPSIHKTTGSVSTLLLPCYQWDLKRVCRGKCHFLRDRKTLFDEAPCWSSAHCDMTWNCNITWHSEEGLLINLTCTEQAHAENSFVCVFFLFSSP